MSIICKFCEAKLSNNSALYRHQREVKTCIQIQEKIKTQIEDKDKEIYTCICKLEYHNNIEYEDHINKCLDYLNNYIKKLKDEIKRLNENKPNQITNNIGNNTINGDINITNNIYYLTIETNIDNILKKYPQFKSVLTKVSKDIKGDMLADTVFTNIENNQYLVKYVDKNRLHFTYKDKDGNVITDNGGHKLEKIVKKNWKTTWIRQQRNVSQIELMIQLYQKMKC